MRTTIALVLFCTCSASISSASDVPPIFASLEGAWHSDGQAFGQAARSNMQWQVTLDGRFYRIDYTIAFGPAEAPTGSFSGVGYYRITTDEETINGFWADNTGDLHPIEAMVSDDNVLSTWGEQGKKLGRTQYRILDDGRVEVTDWIWRDGAFRQFNQNTFDRNEL